MTPRRRVVLLGLGLSALHFFVSAELFLWIVSVRMQRLDTGGAPSPAERAGEVLLAVMQLPAFVLARSVPNLSATVFWLLVAAADLSWGFAAAWIARRLATALVTPRPEAAP